MKPLKKLTSHFDLTPKTIGAVVAACLSVAVLNGRITQSAMDAYLMVLAAVLACLVPERKGK